MRFLRYFLWYENFPFFYDKKIIKNMNNEETLIQHKNINLYSKEDKRNTWMLNTSLYTIKENFQFQLRWKLQHF